MGKITLRRYTNLAATIHILQNKAISLLDPASWDDRNDTYFMDHYKSQKNLKTLLALCFAEASETYHHWKIFSSGFDGVCIEFDKNNLVAAMEKEAVIMADFVDYYQIKDLKASPPLLERLIFAKRFPYTDEKEFRVVYQDKSESLPAKDFPIGTVKLTYCPYIHI